jgi:hypothetical protein
MKLRFFALACMLASGCSTTSLQDSGAYTLDLERSQLCYSGNNRCLNLELIIPSYNETHIARAYGLPATSASWNVRDLVQLMLAPPNGQYEARQISDYRYELPRNYATNTVWDYLMLEQHQLYEGNATRDD